MILGEKINKSAKKKKSVALDNMWLDSEPFNIYLDLIAINKNKINSLVEWTKNILSLFILSKKKRL